MDSHRLYRFPKSEKLCNVREISSLFKGETIFVFPFKVGYDICNTNNNDPLTLKVLCSVGKRYSKSAVKRNLIKRRIREAYRLNRHILTESTTRSGMKINIAFIYVSPKEESYATQERAMQRALQKIADIIAKSSDNSSATDN